MSSRLPSLLLEYISLHSSARISAVSQMTPFLWLYKPPKIPLNLVNVVNTHVASADSWMAGGPCDDGITTGTTWIPASPAWASKERHALRWQARPVGAQPLVVLVIRRKDRDGKHNPTPHSRSPPLQPVYLRSCLGSRG